MESLFSAPLELLSDGYGYITDFIKSISWTFGLMSTVFMFIVLMPLIELVFIGIRIVKIPANIWLGSFRRVTGKLGSLTDLKTIRNPLSRQKKKWDAMVKRA